MRNLFLLTTLVISTTACNLYGGLSKPADDQQYLLAARACLDQGNYECALANYNSLSSAYNDVKIDEIALTVLAQDNIFSMKDLISSLGTSTGSGASFAFMANGLASRGVKSAAIRTTIQTLYLSGNSIVNPKIKAFSQFITSLAMFNEILANAVQGTTLQSSDLAANGPQCKALAAGACVANASGYCSAPAGTQFTYNAGDTSDITSATAVSGTATIQKLVNAAAAATSQLSNLTGKSSNFSGVVAAIQALNTLPAGGEPCARQLLITTLDL